MLVAITGGVLAAVIAACSTPSGAGGGAANAGSQGERYFKLKCNACHPNGGQGAGPPIDLSLAPSFLERGKTSGRHGVPEFEFEPLIAYMNQAFGAGMVAGTPTPTPTPMPTTPTPTTPTPTTPTPTPTPTAAAPTGDPAKGERYFQAKCNRCHPNGGKGVGPSTLARPVPGPLKVATTGGRHDVPGDEYDSLLTFMVQKYGATMGGATAAAPAPTPTVTPTPTPTVTPTPTPAVTTAAASGDPAAGATYYQAKCNKCHPGGNKGVGPAVAGKPLPGVLVSGGSGKHGVEAAQFENLLAYMVTLGAVRTGGAPTTTAPAATTTTTTPPATTTTTTGSGIPTNAGMVPYQCSCQCPANTPPAALPAACVCQCTPR
jgi:mono/diheme cytochrome c family protein